MSTTTSTWLEEVQEALTSLGGEAYLNEIYYYIQNNSQRNLSNSFQATIRATLERYSSDSDAFIHKEDIFYVANEKGNGRWGLRK